VLYLNGSKIATSGAALTFDGTNFATTGTATAAKLIPTGSSATGNGLYLPATNALGLSTNGTNAVYIDSTQNVGIGVTPSANSIAKALELQTGFNIFGYANLGYINANAYYNGGWLYKNTDVAGRYEIGGAHKWFNAPSGTVGNAISFVQAMTLDGSGNLGIGTNSPAGRLDVQSAEGRVIVTSTTGTNASYYTAVNTGGSFFVGRDSSTGGLSGTAYAATLLSTGAYPMVFGTNSAERMRISSAGIVTMSAYGVGTATFSAAGVISSVSDETWKIKDGIPVDPDSMLKKLEPGYWYYNDEKKEIFGVDRQLGFYAQNVNAAIGPEAAPTPETVISKAEDGTDIVTTKPWGYYDRSVLAVTVMSLQKALATIESLTARIEALEAK
jgi:hypothetical protein